jgi:hypothetical protein
LSLTALVLGGVVAVVVLVLIGGSGGSCHGAHCSHSKSQVALKPSGQTGDGGATSPGSTNNANGHPGPNGGATAASAGASSGGANGTGGTPGSKDSPGKHGRAQGGSGGALGANGSAGGANGTVPAGATVNGYSAGTNTQTGSWSAASPPNPELPPQYTTATIAFPVALPRSVEEGAVTYVSEAETKKPGAARSAKVRAGCGETGTLQSPTAAPGHLCVYVGSEDFRDHDPSGGVPTHGGAPFVDAGFFAIVKKDGAEGANKTGARVLFAVRDLRTQDEERANAFPYIRASGSWAVAGP